MHTRPLLAERLNDGQLPHGKTTPHRHCGLVVLSLLLLLACAWCASARSAVLTVEKETVEKESPAVIARTSCGVVQGRTQAGGVAAFRGIPFGEAGRFLPPTPAACWHGVLDALADGPGCPGMKPPYGPPAVSEQCLTLNVFTPVAALGNASARLSVLVWLYGGSLVEGSVASYGAIENLVSGSGGRAMLVAMNYRLGALGFAALEELASADPRGVSGNYGILDQQLAMRWVAKNAAAFGGDAAKVTLLGQSSGGTSILAHLAAPASRGLFHAAIPRSGIRILIQPALEWTRGLEWSALPYVDGVTITRGSLEAAREGYSAPLLLQMLEGELDWQPDPALAALRSRADAAAYIEAKLTPGFGAAAARLYSIYAGVGGENETLPAAPAYALTADTGATCGSLALAVEAGAARRRSGTAAVFLSLVRARPHHPLFLEDCHTPSIYAFHLFDFIAAMSVGAPTAAAVSAWGWDPDVSYWPGSRCGPYRPAPADVALGRALLRQWLSFAEHAGFPAGEGWRAVDDEPGWPAHYAHGVIGDGGRTTSEVDLKTAACAAWREAGVGQEWWWIN
ncbi:hypothetical protein EMIHUDRAFT_98624 [Emiliania huxleyi CCMP1516]|uniref:Carboxylic ester hydrolase n=2 Tax=Emiliania huxleyi TaxID=2903 RepID=A0A0D3KEM4_EMIH1|nr:hypothetical protein EMIHUDRAFT_98624 [Emiliania huxleyi CCMP1516]EOD34209.1 hypothetical protein EMIHUDRAFT_98624 [Emiliania huxleyi CCMP1516]|eukprot:XP_005786638.1 hypothetical protein EMIHUDRAFT_98624 [Emiliania huxleyi CCMP1516]